MMSMQTLIWVHAAHFIGFVLWSAGLIGCLHMLAAHGRAGTDAGAALAGAEKRVAMVMDIGATVAIAAGVTMGFGMGTHPFAMAWMHLKLTLVVGLLALHGFVRVKIKKFGRGETAPLPGFALPAGYFLIIAILIVATTRLR